jgi:multisubunit Na+/H+ antiporter MnhE subunit
VWKVDYQNLLAGFIVSLAAVVVFGGIGAEKDGTKFSLRKAPAFAGYALYVLALWVEGALTQIIASLFDSGGENGKNSGTLWIETGFKKTASKFFLMHALYYAPYVIAVDFEDDKALVVWHGGDGDVPARTRRSIERLIKRLTEIFE